MRDLVQLQMLQSVYGSLGGGAGWLTLAVFLCLVGIAVFKPERIMSLGWFRWSGTTLGLSVAIPAATNFALVLMESSSSTRGGGSGTGMLWAAISAAQPVLLGLSIVTLLAALNPSRKNRPMIVPPQPHPLD